MFLIRYYGMRSWVLSIIGVVCLAGSLSGAAIGQGGTAQVANRDSSAIPQVKAFKEVKFKLEWTVKNLSAAAGANALISSDEVTVTSAEGQTSMTTNQVPTEDKYRRIILHSEQQNDGSYLVNLGVTDLAKDQDIPRLDTMVKVKFGETKIVQDRISKGSNYNYQYQILITPILE